ncbi:MAG: TlpA family protein disulfide reductase [Flavobacteriales bacterium]|nr:MAG: TlpA family protein disulfide reductase [Flavobacteriales bacterium]
MLFRYLSCLLLILAGAAHASAGHLRSFAPGTMERIVAERQGRSFVLAFWSIGCAHCPAELKALGALKRRYPGLDVVLVATDSQDEAPRAAEIAAGFGLRSTQQWIFSDEAAPERLRFEIDPKWYGELPRTYLFDRNHRIEAVSGLIPAARLERWVKENAR